MIRSVAERSLVHNTALLLAIIKFVFSTCHSWVQIHRDIEVVNVFIPVAWPGWGSVRLDPSGERPQIFRTRAQIKKNHPKLH